MMKMTSVSKLSDFLNKALPEGGVYSSEEAPPEGTTIFYTERGKAYWCRSQQAPSKQEDPHVAIPFPFKLDISDATKQYLEDYQEEFAARGKEFDKLVDDPKSPEHKLMAAMVRFMIDEEYGGFEAGKNPKDVIKTLGHEEGNKTGRLRISIQDNFEKIKTKRSV